jgi:twitching motility protein PilT
VNAPPICEKACSLPNGLVLVCGPTGSGKSTTLSAMLDHINSTTKGHILTLEDPIEFLYENKMCLVNQRGMGVHFTDFSSALKAAMREDPDVILVGEMRDAETIALALKAAETGHLVFSTLHTNSAAKTVDRVIDVFPHEAQGQVRSQLAVTLQGVLSQNLVAKVGGGRALALEVMVANPAVRNLIREGKTYQIATSMQTGKADGMQVLDKVLLEAVQEGKIDGEDAWEQANDKVPFSQWAPKPAPVRAKAAYVASTGSFIVDQAKLGVKSVTPASGAQAPEGQAVPQVKPVVKKIA